MVIPLLMSHLFNLNIYLELLATRNWFQYDAILCESFTPYLIDLVNQGSVIIPDLAVEIPEQFFDPDLPYHLYVPGSQVASIAVFGLSFLPCLYPYYFYGFKIMYFFTPKYFPLFGAYSN